MRIVFLALLLGLDVVSKIVALEQIPPMTIGAYPYGGIGVFANFLGVSFSLNTIVNTGAAWGLFAGHSGLLFGIRTAVILGLVGYLFWSKRRESPTIPLALVVVGAVGNAIDYMLYGHVVDFFHFVFWGSSFPIFNLADSYITLGVLGLLFLKRTAQKQRTV
jgi:signal peptidase II